MKIQRYCVKDKQHGQCVYTHIEARSRNQCCRG